MSFKEALFMIATTLWIIWMFSGWLTEEPVSFYNDDRIPMQMKDPE